jgi:peptidoglycan/xylan/chitin deacetylase (PgdA/CDA1 family)
MRQSILVSFLFHKIGDSRYSGDVYSLPVTYLIRLIELAQQHSCRIAPWGELLSNNDWPDNSVKLALTFDDGYESDYSEVLPILLESSIIASFFIVPEWIGEPGYMNWDQVRSLSESGMEIGSHTLTHAWLPELPSRKLQFELVSSRRRIENQIHKPVAMLSLPGGYYNSRILESAWEAGYRFVGTSDYGIDPLDSQADLNHWVFKRNSMDTRMTWSDVKSLIRGRAPSKLALLNLKRQLSKVIGPTNYYAVSNFVRRRL